MFQKKGQTPKAHMKACPKLELKGFRIEYIGIEVINPNPIECKKKDFVI